MTCQFCNDYTDGWNEGQSDGHKDGYQFGFSAGLAQGQKFVGTIEQHMLATKIHLIAKQMRQKGDNGDFWILLTVIEDLCAPHLAKDAEEEGVPI